MNHDDALTLTCFLETIGALEKLSPLEAHAVQRTLFGLVSRIVERARDEWKAGALLAAYDALDEQQGALFERWRSQQGWPQ